VAGRNHHLFPDREYRPQGGGYSAFGAKEGGEDDVKYNPSSPRFTHYRVEDNAIHP
jgi:hypothetical protein